LPSDFASWNFVGLTLPGKAGRHANIVDISCFDDVVEGLHLERRVNVK